MITDLVRARFIQKINRTSTCWEWVGRWKTNRGYGLFYLNGKNVKAHRLSYRMFKGSIPNHLELDHLCRNTSCVNPEHLEAVSHKENILRGNCPTAINARKTHCKRGHALVKDNLDNYKLKMGERDCLKCKRIHATKYRRKVATLKNLMGRAV